MYESCKVLIIKYIFIKSDSSTRKNIKEVYTSVPVFIYPAKNYF